MFKRFSAAALLSTAALAMGGCGGSGLTAIRDDVNPANTAAYLAAGQDDKAAAALGSVNNFADKANFKLSKSAGSNPTDPQQFYGTSSGDSSKTVTFYLFEKSGKPVIAAASFEARERGYLVTDASYEAIAKDLIKRAAPEAEIIKSISDATRETFKERLRTIIRAEPSDENNEAFRTLLNDISRALGRPGVDVADADINWGTNRDGNKSVTAAISGDKIEIAFNESFNYIYVSLGANPGTLVKATAAAHTAAALSSSLGADLFSNKSPDVILNFAKNSSQRFSLAPARALAPAGQ